MRIHTYICYQWIDALNKYVLVSEEGYDWNGEISLCKGASSEQSNLAKSQAEFYDTLTKDFGTQFAEQGNILSKLTASLSPTLLAGPNQFGFNAAEVNALNSSAIQNTGQQYQNAQKALQEGQAAQGGGNVYLPSGANQQQAAQLASSAANQTSNQLLGVQQAGYQTGLNNYNNAVSALTGVSSQYNPNAYAGSANSAGSSAFGSATEVNKENQAASPWNVVGGILGGVAQAGLGLATGGLSTAASGILGSLTSGGKTGGIDYGAPFGGNLPQGSFGGGMPDIWGGG
jgi:hypothetical protein